MMEKYWLLFCPKETFLGVDLISVTSAQSQNNDTAFPPTLHSLQPNISSTKSSFSKQLSAELRTSKAIFPLQEAFAIHLFPVVTILYQISHWLSGPMSKRCFSSKTYTHLHWHRLQSSNFCLKGVKRSGLTEEHKKDHHLRKSNIPPKLSILCKRLVLQHFNCCYMN